MIRVAVIPAVGGVPAAVRCLRSHTDLPIGEIGARLADGRAIVEFPIGGDTVPEVRKCRAFLRDVERAGATVRAPEQVDGYPEEQESVQLLRNVMRQNVQIAKDQRERPG